MTQPKPYISRAATLQDALAAVAKLPGIISRAIGDWGEVEIIVRKREAKRSIDQNRLQRKWCKEASEQGDMTAEEYRGYCKLHFGMQILCRDSEEYLAACQKVLGGLAYDQKLALMMQPHDYPVTRGMTKRQKSEYLDMCWQHFTGLGFRLTDPGQKGMDDWREAA